ncbi:MAG: hypothetical protein HDQ99_02725 [Lachnospiraceae bacterium]|nr:hypothetical protein [Lachnospiraceae bacterium]
MKKVFILEENDVEELIKNANITMAILGTVLREDNVDQITREQLIHAKSAIDKMNDILGK